MIAPAAAGCKRLLPGSQGESTDALRRQPDASAELAAELLASLDDPADTDAMTAWDAQIDRRPASIEAGTIALEPWGDVTRRIERSMMRPLPSIGATPSDVAKMIRQAEAA